MAGYLNLLDNLYNSECFFLLTFQPTILNFNWTGSYSYFNLLTILIEIDLLGMVLVIFH